MTSHGHANPAGAKAVTPQSQTVRTVALSALAGGAVVALWAVAWLARGWQGTGTGGAALLPASFSLALLLAVPVLVIGLMRGLGAALVAGLAGLAGIAALAVAGIGPWWMVPATLAAHVLPAWLLVSQGLRYDRDEAGRLEFYPADILLEQLALLAVGLLLVSVGVAAAFGTPLPLLLALMILPWAEGNAPSPEGAQALAGSLALLLPFAMAWAGLAVLLMQLWLAQALANRWGGMLRPKMRLLQPRLSRPMAALSLLALVVLPVAVVLGGSDPVAGFVAINAALILIFPALCAGIDLFAKIARGRVWGFVMFPLVIILLVPPLFLVVGLVGVADHFRHWRQKQDQRIARLES